MKKFLAALLCLSLIACLFVGCSGSTDAPANADTEPAQASTPAPESTDVSEAPEAEASQEEGTDAPAYTKVAYDLPLFQDQLEITVFYTLRGSNNGNFPNRDDIDFWKTTQEKLNVDLVFQEPGESVATEKFNLMCASGDLTDLICENNLASMGSTAYTGGYDKAIADEIYIDLMPYVEEYAPNYAYYILGDASNRKNAITDEGHLATFLQVYDEQQLNNMGSAVNKTYMDATGLDLPTTISEWMDVYAAMADNGVKYPVEANSEGAIMQGAFANALGATIATSFVMAADTREFVFGPTTDETREYIELFRELNAKGWMHPDWMNINGMDRTYFNNGEVPTRNIMINELTNYEAMYGIAVEALPVVCREGYSDNKTAMGTDGQALASSQGGMAVTTVCQDVEAVMKFMDWFYSDEGADMANMGWEEGVLWVYNDDGTRSVTELYQQKNENDMEYKNLLTHDGDFALCYPNMRYDIATEQEKTIYDMWESDTSNEAAIYYSLPQAISLTSKESEDITSALTDLSTYVETTIFSWMALEAELNDASWDEFVATCQGMRLDDIQAVYEAAYQRYLDK